MFIKCILRVFDGGVFYPIVKFWGRKCAAHFLSLTGFMLFSFYHSSDAYEKSANISDVGA